MNEMEIEVEHLLQEITDKVEFSEKRSHEVLQRIKEEKKESTDCEVNTTCEYLKQEIDLPFQNVTEKTEFLEENKHREIISQIKEEKMESTDCEVNTTCEYLKQEIHLPFQNVTEKNEFLEENKHLEIMSQIKEEKEDDCRDKEIECVLDEVIEEVEYHEESKLQKKMKVRRKCKLRGNGRLRDELGRFIPYPGGRGMKKHRRGIRRSELEKLALSFGSFKLGHHYRSKTSLISHRTRSKLHRKSKRLTRSKKVIG